MIIRRLKYPRDILIDLPVVMFEKLMDIDLGGLNYIEQYVEGNQVCWTHWDG
ncbi:hypothetical protein [Neobacillus piezotolerans]|uniref:hypothetical protein n=1 Tax=Neobacillus piezotolerans TaxID=2259171 RepID=UPI0015F19491|nr:hypothetical protein [Neobacillus piezotolerans]